MAGFNLLGQNNPTTPQASSFQSPNLNSSSTFGSTPNQQNLSFGSSITSGTSIFGSPNVTVSQANLSFGSSTLGSSIVDPNKSTFGYNSAGSPTTATTTASVARSIFGPTFSAASQPTFGATASSQASFGGGMAGQSTFSGTPSNAQPTFGASAIVQPTFGASAPAQPTFGASAPAQPTFGGPAIAQPIFSGSATAQPTFGGSTLAQPTFAGAATVQPTFGGTSAAHPTFGVPAAAQPTFGGPAAAQPTFGASVPVQPTFGGSTTAQSTFGGPATAQPTFGGTAAPQTTFSGSTVAQQPTFGASAISQPLSFATAGSTQQSLFGAATSTQPLSFAATSTVQPPSFSATSSSSALTFGAASTTQAPLFSTASTPSAVQFGAANAASSTPNAPGTAQTSAFASPNTTQQLTFGTIATAQPTLSFGATSTAQTPSCGTVSSAPATSFGVVTSAPSSALSIAVTPSLSFGATSTSQPLFGATSSAQPTSLGSTLKSVDATTASSQSSLGGVGLATSFSGLNASTVGSSATTAPTLFSFSTATATSASSGGAFTWQKTSVETPTVQTTTSTGLGGVDHSAVTTAKWSANTFTSVKEQPLPNEIQQTVVAFKEYVKTQKNLSSEVARSSAEPLTKLTQQIASLNNLILTLGSVLSQQKFTAEKIKIETIKSLNDYELAQKIKDSPVASEERMLSIRKYFAEKISAFEESTKVLQEKIEYVYQHVITLPQENSLSAEALKLIVKKLHDSFVVISARTYKLHNDMQLLKVQYLTLRNQYIKDNSSISFSLNHELQLPSETSGRKTTSDLTLEGPNPFSRSGNGSFNSLLLTSQNRNFAAGSSKEWGSVGPSGVSSNPFGVGEHAGNSLLDQTYSLTSPSANQHFNLQKPPLGNKRGKR